MAGNNNRFADGEEEVSPPVQRRQNRFSVEADLVVPEPVPAEQITPARLSDGSSSAGSFGDMLDQARSFGLSDEINAAGRATGRWLKGVTGAGAPVGWSDAYADTIREERGKLDSYAAQNPGLALAANVVGAVTTPIGGVVSAATAAPSLATRTFGAANTARGAAGRIATAGGAYGAAQGASTTNAVGERSIDDLVAERAPAPTWGEELSQRAGGAINGAVIGAPMALATAGLVRGVQGVANSVAPAFQSARFMARNPGQEGLRKVAQNASDDGVDFGDMYREMTPQRGAAGSPHDLPQPQIDELIDRATIAGQSVIDIARSMNISQQTAVHWLRRHHKEVMPHFQGQNILENAVTPRRANPNQVAIAPNLTSTVRDAASTDGVGRARLANAVRQRQADQADVIADTLHDIFGSKDFNAHREAVAGGTARATSKLYNNRLYNQPMMKLADNPQVAHLLDDPLFQRSVDFARREAAISQQPWDADAFSPRQIDMIQRQLRLAGQRSTDPNEANLARAIRQQFLAVADDHLPAFAGIRGEYRHRMLREEALDAGQAFALGRDTPSISTGGGRPTVTPSQFIREQQQALANAEKEVATWASVFRRTRRADHLAELNAARGRRVDVADLVDDFRRSFGAGLETLLDRGRDSGRFLTTANTRAALRRVTAVMPRDLAHQYIAVIRNHSRQWETAREIYGNSITAAALKKQSSGEIAGEIAAGAATLNAPRLAKGASRWLSREMRQRQDDAINTLMSQTNQGKVRDAVRQLSRIAPRLRPPAIDLRAAHVGSATARYATMAPRDDQSTGRR